MTNIRYVVKDEEVEKGKKEEEKKTMLNAERNWRK